MTNNQDLNLLKNITRQSERIKMKAADEKNSGISSGEETNARKKEIAEKRKKEQLESIRSKFPLIKGSAVEIITNEPLPETAKFVPIDGNIIGDGLPAAVLNAIEEGLKNKICCSCTNLECGKNENCECRKVGKRLTSMEYGGIMKKKQKIYIADMFSKKMLYACGKDCPCQGKCEIGGFNNSELPKLVVKKRGAKGFCLFAKEKIKKGQVIVPFYGKLVGTRGMNSANWLYSVQSSGSEYQPLLIDHLWFASDLTDKKYQRKHKQGFENNVFLAVLKEGTAARFAAHSCSPNAGIRRLMRNGIGPANITQVLYAKKVIEAGSEITFDYGPAYLDNNFIGHCLCGAKNCRKKGTAQVAQSTVQAPPAAVLRNSNQRPLRRSPRF